MAKNKASRGAPGSAASRQAQRPRIGLALGSGAARGWAHIGIVEGLIEHGIKPDIVCGASIGALVGAAYVQGNLAELRDWALALRRTDYLRLLDVRITGGGLVAGRRLMDALEKFLPDRSIESLPLPFAAVATDLVSGREIWLREGSLREAVRASISVPGIFTPVERGAQWLVDGGLVNPVPISVCRALGAYSVIAVNLNGERSERWQVEQPAVESEGHPDALEALEPLEEEVGSVLGLGRGLRKRATKLVAQVLGPTERGPGLLEVMAGSIIIMQNRITRSRMAGDPPEVLLSPRLAAVSLMDFDQAAVAIAEGRATVERMLPALRDALPV